MAVLPKAIKQEARIMDCHGKQVRLAMTRVSRHKVDLSSQEWVLATLGRLDFVRFLAR